MGLTESERRELLDLEREKCERSLAFFVRQAWPIVDPSPYLHNWHIDAVCDHLEACGFALIRDLIINIPPRMAKSLLVSVMFPAWVWTRMPEKRFLCSSYAATLSRRDSVKCRRVIESPWYQNHWGDRFQLAGDQNAKDKYENTRAGHRIATSVGGVGTGEGGDIIIVDDPHNVKEMESDDQRNTAIDWWDHTMSTRGNDPRTVVRIVVMQRLHEKDLTGHLEARGGYERLVLPMAYAPARAAQTSLGSPDPRTKEGELLFPSRFPAAEVAKLRSELGALEAAGQLDQLPAPETGHMINRSWWRFYDEAPLLDWFETIAISADLTFKDKETGDWVVFQVWGRHGADKYLLRQVREQIDYVRQEKRFRRLVREVPEAGAKWIEDAANGAALVSRCRRNIPGVIAVPPQGSKIARAKAVTPQIEAGNVFLPNPEKHPWVEGYLLEWDRFPRGEHDDQVDATSLALNQFDKQFSLEDLLPRAIDRNEAQELLDAIEAGTINPWRTAL